MIDAEQWMRRLVGLLKEWFGSRLQFAGLQGSYARGEAHEQSDIDVMVVLNRLDAGDLIEYRRILSQMPQGEKACGFICGARELLHWPRYELFQLKKGTMAYYGSLDGLLPETTREDVTQSVRINAANLYHMACHTFLYADDERKRDTIAVFEKNVFYIMQLTYYLESGEYIPTKKGLAERVSQQGKDLLCRDPKQIPDGYIAELIGWCSRLIA